MAKVVLRGYDLTVNTWADLQALPSSKKVDEAQVTVLDAIGDTRTLGGTVLYQYIAVYAGTPEEWMIISESNEEAVQAVEENLLILDGKVTLIDTPNAGTLFDVMVSYVENGISFVEDVAYSINDKDVFVSAIYNGKTLIVKYLKNTSGKLYQMGTSIGGVSSFNDLTDKPTTIDGYGISDAYTKAEVDAVINDVQAITPNLSDVSSNIIPDANSVYTIGSATNRFKSIYVDEAYLSTNTLYIGDTAVMGTEADTIVVKADLNQSVSVQTTGTGVTSIQSEHEVNISTDGSNADVKVQATGTNSKVRFSGTGGIEFSNVVSAQSDLNVSGNLTVSGNVTANGSQFLVNATTVATKDNIITLNSGEVGTGVTSGKSGIQIDRGDASDYQLIFDEVTDKFIVGAVGGTFETLATREYVSGAVYTKTEADVALNLKANLASPTFTGTVSGITKAMVGLGNVDNTADTAKPVSTATQTALNLKANSADVYTKVQTDSAISTAVGIVIDSAPAALDTLNELAAALGDDANYAATITTTLATKVDKVVGKGLSTEDYTTAEKTKLSGIAAGAQINTVVSVAGKTGAVALVKGDVGLGSVDNTTDLLKPISTATQTALNGKVDENVNIVAGTFTKITYDVKGLVTAGTSLVASDIPMLDAGKITSGIISADRLPLIIDCGGAA